MFNSSSCWAINIISIQMDAEVTWICFVFHGGRGSSLIWGMCFFKNTPAMFKIVLNSEKVYKSDQFGWTGSVQPVLHSPSCHAAMINEGQSPPDHSGKGVGWDDELCFYQTLWHVSSVAIMSDTHRDLMQVIPLIFTSGLILRRNPSELSEPIEGEGVNTSRAEMGGKMLSFPPAD